MVSPVQVDRTHVRYRARKLIYFSGCDYFRLASHPSVLEACRSGLHLHGLNVAASRSTTGNHPIYGMVEAELAAFFAVPESVLFPNGYMANIAVAQAFKGNITHVLLDSAAHSSLADAAALLGCNVLRFDHGNPVAVERIVRQAGPRARLMLLTDGVFPQNGAIAPLHEYARVLPRNSWTWVDDAHGAGVLGSNGRGVAEHHGIEDHPRLVQTITLSKAFGVYGGAVLGSSRVADQVLKNSQAFVGSTPVPLPIASAIRASLALLRSDGSFRERLARNVQVVKQGFRNLGYSVPDTPVPIVALAPENERERVRWQKRLFACGIYPPWITYPGALSTGCFRFALSSEHSAAQLGALLAAFTK